MSPLHLPLLVNHPVAVSPKPVYLFFKVLRGTDTGCWAGFYSLSLSPHIVVLAPAPCWRDSGSRDSGTIFWAGVGWGRADWARSWARLKKEKSNNRQKISLVAPQQPLEQQAGGGVSASENGRLLLLKSQNRCIHNPRTKVKLRLRLTLWWSKFIVKFPSWDYPRIEALWNAFSERNYKRGWICGLRATMNYQVGKSDWRM